MAESAKTLVPVESKVHMLRLGSIILHLIIDPSAPWGVELKGGRKARFAWCWSQVEAATPRKGFMFFRVLSFGRVCLTWGRLILIDVTDPAKPLARP